MTQNQTPEWLRPGTLVEFSFCVGEVIDVAVSSERIMVLVRSPKGIWRNHSTEWLEYKEGAIKPASHERVERDIELYRTYIKKMLQELDILADDWHDKISNKETIPA